MDTPYYTNGNGLFYQGDRRPGDREATEQEILERFGEPEANALSLMQRQFTAAIDAHMNAFAVSRGYDSMASAASYAGDETDPVFAAEGDYAKRMRSLVYRQGYIIIEDVLAGRRPMPTIEVVLAELPALIWPDVEGAEI